MIASNISSVIRRLDAVQKRLPGRVQEAIVELPWETTAAAALAAVSLPGEDRLIAALMATLRQSLSGGRTELTLRGPTGVVAAGLAAAAAFDRQYFSTRRPGDSQRLGELSNSVAAMQQAVTDWVYAPYTGRDDPASGKDLTAAEHEHPSLAVNALYRILGLVPLSPAELSSSERLEAARRLTVRIEEFVAAHGGGISSERVRTLLGAVSAAWTYLARTEIPGIVRNCMRDLLAN